MKVLLFATVAFTLASTPSIAETGEEAYNKLCLSCHLISKEKGVKGIAPPIFAVKHHVKKAYPNREDFIQTVIDWVEEPSTNTSLMSGAVKKFGLMPKLPYSASDVRKTAEFIYDTNFVLPDWYKKHYKEKHGQNIK